MRKSFIVAGVFVGMLAMNALANAGGGSSQGSCKQIIDCIIDNADNILQTLHQSEQEFSSGNQKLVYQLAKQYQSTKTRIMPMISAISEETRLRPNNEIAKDYFIGHLKSGAIKNETVYEGSASLEHENFKGKLYVEGYKADMDLKGLSVVSTNDRDFTVRNSLEGLKEAWSKMSGRAQPETWWFTKEGVFYSYGFFSTGRGKTCKWIADIREEVRLSYDLRRMCWVIILPTTG